MKPVDIRSMIFKGLMFVSFQFVGFFFFRPVTSTSVDFLLMMRAFKFLGFEPAVSKDEHMSMCTHFYVQNTHRKQSCFNDEAS